MTQSATPFEQDMNEQPTALRAFEGDGAAAIAAVIAAAPNRILLTGMGSSHHAGEALHRQLVAAGHAVWALDTARVLSLPSILTSGTLVIATSQSGASGETVALLDMVRAKGASLAAITADAGSPLAAQADYTLLLDSGEEATVSTKSYLNSLAAHYLLASLVNGRSANETKRQIADVADTVQALLAEPSITDADAVDALAGGRGRVVTIGEEAQQATALYAALIIKEAAKVAVEGYSPGEFRHGPYEMAGQNLTVFAFADGPRLGVSFGRLARDLERVGTRVRLIGGENSAFITDPTSLMRAAVGAVAAQQLALELARANNVVPGEFLYGSKVTTVV